MTHLCNYFSTLNLIMTFLGNCLLFELALGIINLVRAAFRFLLDPSWSRLYKFGQVSVVKIKFPIELVPNLWYRPSAYQSPFINIILPPTPDPFKFQLFWPNFRALGFPGLIFLFNYWGRLLTRYAYWVKRIFRSAPLPVNVQSHFLSFWFYPVVCLLNF